MWIGSSVMAVLLHLLKTICHDQPKLLATEKPPKRRSVSSVLLYFQDRRGGSFFTKHGLERLLKAVISYMKFVFKISVDYHRLRRNA